MRFFAKGTAPVSANDLVLPDDLIPGVREKSEKRRWPTTADINIKVRCMLAAVPSAGALAFWTT